MTTPVISVRAATKRFGDCLAVDGVSLDVAPGEFVTLLGPSGCGKTTLLRLIAGFARPDTGTVHIEGRDVTALPPHKREVHTVFQQYALFPHLTVAGNVAFGLERKAASRAEVARRVAEALDLVRLPGLGDRYPSQLSGGQQQRVAIARALVLDPRVLLLDEPLGALDRKLREAMQTELKELQRGLGIGFLFVTHDQGEALAMSDRVAVMDSGRIEQLGTPRDVYERPRTRFVADFVGATNLVEGTVVSAADGRALVDAAGGRVAVEARLEPGRRVLLAVRPEKIRFVENGGAAITATVEEARYLGDATHWRVRLEDATAWTVVARDGADAGLEPGRRVGLSWDAAHSIHLER